MVIFIILGTLAGILFGFLFSVFVLLPAMLLATAVITTIAFANGLGLGTIALIVFGAIAPLQIGYIVGCVIHTAAPPAPPRISASSA